MTLNFKNFKHRLCVTYLCNLYNSPVGKRDEISNWLENYIGKDNFIFGLEDYGQDGQWML